MKKALQIIFSIVLMILGCFLIAAALNKCNSDPEIKLPNRVDSLEIVNSKLLAEIRIEKHQKDSIHSAVEKSDSISKSWENKYYAARSRALNSGNKFQQMPCDSAKKYFPIIVNLCDSTIDSKNKVIEDQQNEIEKDNSIIAKQDSVIVNDSIQKQDLKNENKALEKSLKTTKKKLRFWQIFSVSGWAFGLLK